MIETPNRRGGLCFEHCSFGFRNCFGIRASEFIFPTRAAAILVALAACSSFASAEETPAPAKIRVAVYSDAGAGKSIKNLSAALAGDERLSVAKITAEEIRAGKLKDFDILIHPGGSGSKQGKRLGEEGRRIVRKFVSDGGGFIGICAGAYLASADYSWSLHILDAKVIDRKHWARGTGRVHVQLSDSGKAILNDDSASVEIYYGQGPLLAPADDPEIDDYTALAIYETEIAKRGAPRGVMKGTTAIAAAQFGRGRVLCFSPHPEKTDGLKRYVRRAVLWTQQR